MARFSCTQSRDKIFSRLHLKAGWLSKSQWKSVFRWSSQISTFPIHIPQTRLTAPENYLWTRVYPYELVQSLCAMMKLELSSHPVLLAACEARSSRNVSLTEHLSSVHSTPEGDHVEAQLNSFLIKMRRTWKHR
jgi:hypothetical protein